MQEAAECGALGFRVCVPVRENKAARPAVGRYGTDELSHIFFGPFDGLGPIAVFGSCDKPRSKFELNFFPKSRPRSTLEADLDGSSSSGAGEHLAGVESLGGKTCVFVLRTHTFAEANASPRVLGGDILEAGSGPRHGRISFWRRTIASTISLANEGTFY